LVFMYFVQAVSKNDTVICNGFDFFQRSFLDC
jgi:hypothetical protein